MIIHRKWDLSRAKPHATLSSGTYSQETSLIAYAKYVDEGSEKCLDFYACSMRQQERLKGGFYAYEIVLCSCQQFIIHVERFPVFLDKTSILSSGQSVLLEDTTQSLRWWGSRTSNPSIPSLTLYQLSHCQGSYRQDCVKFKDFSRTSRRLSYTVFKDWNLTKMLIYTLKFYFGNARVHN